MLTPTTGHIRGFTIAVIPPEPDGVEVFLSGVIGTWVLVGLAVGEPVGVGFGVAFGVPLTTGEGSAPPAVIGVLVAVGGVTEGVLILVVGVAVGMEVGVGAFVGVEGGSVGAFVGVGGGSVGVGVAVGVSVRVGVVVSAGNECIPEVVVSNTTVIAEA